MDTQEINGRSMMLHKNIEHLEGELDQKYLESQKQRKNKNEHTKYKQKQHGMFLKNLENWWKNQS